MLSKIWTPQIIDASPAKKYEHRALEDIRESIMELKYYKEHLWKVGGRGDGVGQEGK
jgi:oligoribonuclease